MRLQKYGVLHAVTLCFRHAPGAASAKLAIEAAGGALAPLMVLAVAWFVDGALAYVNKGGRAGPVAAAIALLAGYYAYTQASGIIIRIADAALENALREKLRPRMIRKQAVIPYSILESAETTDLIALVCGDAEGRVSAILNTGIRTVGLAIQVFGILYLLAASLWWAPLLFFAGAIPVALIARKGGRAIYARDKVTIKLTRKHYYLSSILAGRETAAERIMFGYSDDINRKFSATHLKRSNMVTKTIAIEEAAKSFCEFALNSFAVVIVFALLFPAGRGAISHGLYISLVGASIGLVRTTTGSVSRLIGDAAGYIEYMRDYTRFFALPEIEPVAERAAGNARAPFSRLDVRGLRFRYTPDGDYVLNGVSLTIEKGESCSLIGRNGAGKSTLTKILLGLYRDFEGEILIDGVDIARYGADELRGLFSIIYQDYAKYYISLGDNVTLGNAGGDLRASLRMAELEEVAAKLPQKEKTPLGKIYEGGADVSGGEWQKIAIARALYADSPFIILDEPTASLSPMTESKLYRRFAEIIKGKASLLISHRLGSTKLSDKLFVLDNGVIAESGTHDELMAKNGVYAEMFKSQRSWYDES